MLNNHFNYLKNDHVQDIISSWTFFNNSRTLAFVLKPLYDMILALESQTANLSDCYFSLACIFATMKKLPYQMNHDFQKYYIQINNKRFEEFDQDNYLLAFFLNPLYRGKFFVYFILKIFIN